MKIRGTAQHIAEKYSQLARDAQSSGDPVAAENYFQHAEHYFRIIAAAQEQLREQYGYQQRPFDEDGNEEEGFGQGERPELRASGRPGFRQRRGGRSRLPAAALRERAEASALPASTARTVKIARTGATVPSGRIARTGTTARIAATGASASSARPRDARARTSSPRQDFQRDDQPFEARSENGERNERPARFERQDRNDRQDRQDRNDRPERTERFERGIARSAVSASRATAAATRPRRPSRAPCRPS